MSASSNCDMGPRLFTFLGVLALTVPTGQPPSSLRPASVGKVRVSHERLLATACVAQTKQQPRCEARRVNGDSRTSVNFNPVASSDLGHKEDARRPISIELPQGRARTERALQVPAGVWDIEWSGLAPKRFQVRGADELEIALRTLKGDCRRIKRECVLDTAAHIKECSIPEPHRVRH